jgi:septum formation protein
MSCSTGTLLPLLPRLNACFKVVLASGSSRRKELLELIGFDNLTIAVSNFAEDFKHDSFPTPAEYCLATACKKVEQVASTFAESQNEVLVIGADTIIEINGKILEKPVNDSDSRRMLALLSGTQHFVHTAVVAYSNKSGDIQLDSCAFHDAGPDGTPTASSMRQLFAYVETTTVTFSQLTEADIDAYVAMGEGKDKAGSYAIQGVAGQFVASMQGTYYNVMGLPIQSLSQRLAACFS